MCVGSYKMMTLIILALAINGGMYAGTIMYSAYKSAEMQKASSFFREIATIQ